jgi:hypothetical protein
VSYATGIVEVVSSRYPFCFTGGNENQGTISILPFVPFQQDLNRFRLIVRKLPTAKAEIQWGNSSKKFSREQLEQGINLAAEFLDNPFLKSFSDVMAAVEQKQICDLQLSRLLRSFGDLESAFPSSLKDDPVYSQARKTLRQRLIEKQEENIVSLKNMIKPVRHRVEVRPCQD